MWIMLRKRLPVADPPPVLGIFWSTPWPPEGHFKQYFDTKAEWVERHDDYGVDDVGRVPNWMDARKILYKRQEVRVFPHEFSRTPKENMREYISSGAFALVPDSVAEDTLLAKVLDGELRPIYEAALLDGCTHIQAINTAMGIDITMEDAEFPALGWYRPSREIQEYFYDDWEIDGTAVRAKSPSGPSTTPAQRGRRSGESHAAEQKKPVSAK